MNILSIYESPDSIYKTEYFLIIDFYRKNPVQKYALHQCFKDPELYSEIHHISPKWYYRYNHLSIDNSLTNLIRVPYFIHIKLHQLLVQHFKDVNDNINYEKAMNAMYIFKGIFSNKKVNKIQIHVALNNIQIIELLDLFHEYKQYNKYKCKKQKRICIHNVITNENKVVSIDSQLEENWVIGRYVTPEQHQKNIKAGKQLSKKYSGKTETTKGKIRIFNVITHKSKFVSKLAATDYLADGWKIGCIFSEKHLSNVIKFNNSRKNKQTIGTLNKMSITNGYDNMYINKDQTIPNGRRKGMTKKTPTSARQILIMHNDNCKNSIWIYDVKTNKSKRWHDINNIPDGYKRGRHK